MALSDIFPELPKLNPVSPSFLDSSYFPFFHYFLSIALTSFKFLFNLFSMLSLIGLVPQDRIFINFVYDCIIVA